MGVGDLMIIDFHTHLGKPKKGLIHPEIDSSKEALIKAQKEAGVDKAVIFPRPQEPFPEKYREANMKVFKTKGPFIPFIWINPYFFDEEEITESIKKFGVKGIKLHPVFDGYYPTPEFLKDVVQSSINLDIPILFHSLWGSLGKVKYIEKVAESFPRSKIVIAHLKESDGIKVAKKLDNVYLDTSYSPHPRRVEQAVKAVGAKRILFGSDFPFNDMLIQKMMVERAKIKENEKRMILGGNATKLLRI